MLSPAMAMSPAGMPFGADGGAEHLQTSLDKMCAASFPLPRPPRRPLVRGALASQAARAAGALYLTAPSLFAARSQGMRAELGDKLESRRRQWRREQTVQSDNARRRVQALRAEREKCNLRNRQLVEQTKAAVRTHCEPDTHSLLTLSGGLGLGDAPYPAKEVLAKAHRNFQRNLEAYIEHFVPVGGGGGAHTPGGGWSASLAAQPQPQPQPQPHPHQYYSSVDSTVGMQQVGGQVTQAGVRELRRPAPLEHGLGAVSSIDMHPGVASWGSQNTAAWPSPPLPELVRGQGTHGWWQIFLEGNNESSLYS